MEQQRKGLMMAAEAKRNMAQSRAMELQAKHPQLSAHSAEVEENSPVALSGGDAGLARVVGKGRRRKAPAKSRSPSPMAHGGTNGKMETVKMATEGEMHGGASKQGKMLADHLEKVHGAGWLRDFAKGLMSGVKAVGDVVGMVPGPVGMIGKLAKGAIEYGEREGARAAEGGARRRGRPRKVMSQMLHGGASMAPYSNQIAHAPVEDPSVGMPGSARGGQDVPPGGVAPIAYGNVPQAPPSFKRNTVGMGKLTITHGGASHMDGGKKKRAPSARNMAIAKLMKEKGMSLPEASAYLKKHGSA